MKIVKKKNFYFKKNIILVNGKLGKLEFKVPFSLKWVDEKTLYIPKKLFPYFNNLLDNLFFSVNQGWFYQLTFEGRGFKLFKWKNYLSFDLGYSNLFLFELNKNNKIEIHATKQKIVLSSMNKVAILNLIYKIKKFYKLDRYHGKGIFFDKDVKLLYKKLI